MRLRFLLPLIFIAFGSAAGLWTAAGVAQTQAVALRTADTVRVQSHDSAFGMLPPRPGNGGFYTRLFSSQGTEPQVRWISIDGKTTVLFPVASIPLENPKADVAVLDFAPLPDGGMAELVRFQRPGLPEKFEMFQISEFDADGTYRRSIGLLHLSFSPNRLAAFTSGDFFLSGGTPVRFGWKAMSQAIVDGSGNVVKQVQIQLPAATSDEWSGPEPAASAPQESQVAIKAAASSPQAKLINAAEQSKALSGDDGYVYFSWPISENLVYRISDRGDVQTIRLKPQQEQGKTEKLLFVQENHGDLVANSGVVKRTLRNGFSFSSYNLQVYDAGNGKQLATYATQEPIGFGLVYFQPGNFYFLKKMVNPAGFSILRAVPD